MTQDIRITRGLELIHVRLLFMISIYHTRFYIIVTRKHIGGLLNKKNKDFGPPPIKVTLRIKQTDILFIMQLRFKLLTQS